MDTKHVQLLPAVAPTANSKRVFQPLQEVGQQEVVYVALPQPAVPLPRSDRWLSLTNLWRAFRQWWHVVLPLGTLMAIAAAALALYLFVPQYRASALLQISSTTPYSMFENNQQVSPKFVETQVELLRSPVVIESLLSNDEISKLPQIAQNTHPAEWLSSRLNIKRMGDSELFSVYLDDSDPETSAMLLNAILDAYFNIRMQDDHSRSDRVVQLLQEEKSVRLKEVERLQERMRSLRRSGASAAGLSARSDTNEKVALPNDPLRSYEQQLTNMQVERMLLEAQVQATKEAIANPQSVSSQQIDSTVEASDEIRRWRSLLAAKKIELHRIESSSSYGKNDANYSRIEKDIQSYERSLASAISAVRPKIAQSLEAAAKNEQAAELNRLQSNLDAKLALEKVYRQRLDDKLAEMESKGDAADPALELDFTRAELDREQKLVEQISTRLMTLANESQTPGRVAVLRAAEVPQFPLQRLPLREIIAASLIGFFLPTGFLLLWEVGQRRISSSAQLSKNTVGSVVREVAKLDSGVGFRSERHLRLFEESIDSLRVGLQLTDEQINDMKVLAIVSSVQGEGKTSVASQLAVSIARSTGQPTLLIDGDMRAPDIHQIFDVNNNVGLAQVLDGVCSFDEAVVTSWSEHIHLLPSGKLHKSPHHLIGGGRLEALLEDLRMRYCNIIIDTPPILAASEALVIARLADRTLFCTKHNTSRERQVRLAYDRLLDAGVTPVAVVLSAVSASGYANTYGRYDYTT